MHASAQSLCPLKWPLSLQVLIPLQQHLDEGSNFNNLHPSPHKREGTYWYPQLRGITRQIGGKLENFVAATDLE